MSCLNFSWSPFLVQGLWPYLWLLGYTFLRHHELVHDWVLLSLSHGEPWLFLRIALHLCPSPQVRGRLLLSECSEPATSQCRVCHLWLQPEESSQSGQQLFSGLRLITLPLQGPGLHPGWGYTVFMLHRTGNLFHTQELGEFVLDHSTVLLQSKARLTPGHLQQEEGCVLQ